MNDSVDEVNRKRAWSRNARGRGLRWQIQREMVAILSKLALNTSAVQDTMSLRRGLSHKKTTELLEEMKRSGTLKQELDPEVGYYWTTQELGVLVYLGGKRQGIPAGVVEEALILDGARRAEVVE